MTQTNANSNNISDDMEHILAASSVKRFRVQQSKHLSYILRHGAKEHGIDMDSQGYCSVQEIVEKWGLVCGIDTHILDAIVAADNKQRFQYNASRTCIRACQGHSIPLPDMEFKDYVPENVLWHGTAEKNIESISVNGLLPEQRGFVHLSRDKATALTVGARHGKPCAFKVDAVRMYVEGFKFVVSENGVVLIKYVPAKYLELVGHV